MNESINQSVTSHKMMRWTTDIEKSFHAHQPNPWVHSTFHTKSLTSKNHKNIWKKITNEHLSIASCAFSGKNRELCPSTLPTPTLTPPDKGEERPLYKTLVRQKPSTCIPLPSSLFWEHLWQVMKPIKSTKASQKGKKNEKRHRCTDYG